MAFEAILGTWVRLKGVLRLVAAATLVVASAAFAQPPSVSAPAPPMPSSIDARGVDLISRSVVTGATDLHIGPSDHRGLTFARQWTGKAWRIADIPTISGSTYYPIVSFGGKSVPFTTVGGNYQPIFDDGSKLSNDRSTFTASDGTQILFTPSTYLDYTIDSGLGIGTQISFPDGVRWNFNYKTVYQQLGAIPVPPECYNNPPQAEWPLCAQAMASQQYYSLRRLSSITSSTGYQIKLEYAVNTATYSTLASWWTVTKATALNNAVEYCDPVADTCSYANTWPQATYSGWYNGQIASVADPVGRTTYYSYVTGSAGESLISGVRPSGASAATVTYGYTGDAVTGVTANGSSWVYAYPVSGQTAVTDPASQTITTNYDSGGKVTSVVGPSAVGSPTTSYTYCVSTDTDCPVDLLKTVTMPEGNAVTYAYDPRGNVKSTTAVGKPGSGAASLATHAGYDTTCSNVVKCNKPNWTQDALGNQTDYVYDATTGAVTSVKLPADASGVRPETRISYTNYQAYYKNSGGSIVATGLNIALPTMISQCRTSASCSGGADERKTVIYYGTQASGTANNLNALTSTTARGDGALSATSTLTYDNYGRVVTADGPLSADTSMVRYDLAGDVIGKVAPDPDDGDASKFPATRYSYDSWGHAYLTESGTVNSLSDGDWAAFSQVQNTLTEYDGYGRPVRQKSRDSGNNVYQVADTVYDSMGRVQCTRLRMDMGNYGSASDSCGTIQTAGANGPDRVTYNSYDGLGRVYKVTSGYATGAPVDDQTLTFTPNGQINTVTDGENNLTAYVYDGLDRLTTSYFPNPSKGSNASNGSDYEQVGSYDANGNVLTFRTRAGETLTLHYDNLNRLIKKDVPARAGLASTYTRSVFYDYDLLGDMLHARFDSSTGSDAVTNSYDALGRMTDTTLAMNGTSRTLGYAYDAANNLTQFTYPDSNHVFYNRYSTGLLSSLSLNSTSSNYMLAPRVDAQGRPAWMGRWDTVGANWNQGSWNGFDGISRMTALGYDFAGTTYDSTSTFTYNAADQITSKSRSNDAFAWNGATNVSRGYTSNGLNQYSAVGGTSFGYDTDGNLTSDGTNTYVYDVENRLVSRSGGDTSATMRYDPLGRLYEVVGSNTGTTRFLYSGDALVAEYDGSGNMLRRYVHGEGADTPLVWFEGSGLSDAARRYLYSDERGSVIAVTDSSGNVLNTNSYDDYGIPDLSGSITTEIATKGRFRYTGQAYIPEMGMYYYKARMYSPTLGRFMQTDPIGYGDGTNMYAYVHNDAINGTDPSGTDSCAANGWATLSPGYTFNAGKGGIGVEAPECARGVPIWGFGWGSASRPQGGVPGWLPPCVLNQGLICPPGGGWPTPPKKDGNANNDPPQKNASCTAAHANLARVGQDFSDWGDKITWGGIGLVGISGIGAIVAPEAGLAEFEGGETGVSLIEFGGNVSLLGATLKGYANGGLKGAIQAGGSGYVIDRLSKGMASRLFKGAEEASKLVGATMIGKMLDRAQEAFSEVKADC